MRIVLGIYRAVSIGIYRALSKVNGALVVILYPGGGPVSKKGVRSPFLECVELCWNHVWLLVDYMGFFVGICIDLIWGSFVNEKQLCRNCVRRIVDDCRLFVGMYGAFRNRYIKLMCT